MNNTPSEQERVFREWMRAQVTENGVRKYTDNVIISYSYSLRTACHKMVPQVAGNLFAICELGTFDDTYRKIISAKDYDEVNRENGNGAFGVALRLYQSFLKDGGVVNTPHVENDFFARNKGTTYTEFRGKESNYEEVPMKPVQMIFYGAPGTGKSYRVSKILEQEYPDPVERNKHTRRMIFHPTYKYEDFVGSIKPLMSLDKPLDYFYSAGPFTALLKDAFNHPAEKYYLIIEEINRGDSPAIFGDLFQLLDRQENGKSRYVIMNVDVANFMARDPNLKRLFSDGKIWLPANFNILATMNTADENIFVLDSAFKRRFALEYVPIEFQVVPEQWKKDYEVFAGTTQLMDLFRGSELEARARDMYNKGTLQRNWPTFAKMVNYLIDIVNLQTVGANSDAMQKIAENKKLGPFFVSDEELTQPDKFINKVIFYLKQDVFTFSDHYMIDSYEEIYLKFLENKGDIFELLVYKPDQI
ncbi:MAG: AAA family ATPase [Lachnospiraceae bacterium]|nr:AAA family ATPase [Lachnospiraceae bacterium]